MAVTQGNIGDNTQPPAATSLRTNFPIGIGACARGGGCGSDGGRYCCGKSGRGGGGRRGRCKQALMDGFAEWNFRILKKIELRRSL